MKTAPSTQLFCFPYAGASASAYARWRRQLAGSIEVVPVELAGHGWRFSEPLATTMPSLVAQIESQVCPRPGRRFALFGHSFGALVAFEVARRLELRGAAPCALFASACEAPSAPERRGLSADLSDAALIAELRRLDGTPAPVLASAELMQLTLPILRADFQVAASYRRDVRPGMAIAAPIHVFTGATDSLDPAAVSGWRNHTRAGYSLRSFDAGHFFIHERERDVLASVVRELAVSRWARSMESQQARRVE